MPFKELSADAKTEFRYTLGIAGAPNMGKTRSLATLPTPCVIVSLPGEGGTKSLPYGKTGFRIVEWEEPNLAQPVSWKQMRDEVRQKVSEVLSGKYGPMASLALDGMHKYYAVCQNFVKAALYSEDDVIKLDYRKVSPPANDAFFKDLRLWKQFAPPVLILTYWIGYKAEDPADEKSPQHLFHALSGKAGEQIVGETDGTIQAYADGTGKARKFWWRTTTTPEVWGVGLKGSPAIIDKIPPTMPQDWAVLAKYLKGETP